MNRNAIALTLVTLSLASGIALGQESGKRPFTHVAWIPADFDKDTIRFERARILREPVAAYEVTYSYIGQPLASDEYGNRNFTFHVYFRPDELSSQVRKALTEKKGDRGDLAGYFTVTARRESAQRTAIDEARSHFCAGNFVDGMWTPSDAHCKDEIYTMDIAGLSDYMTVRVEPVSVVSRMLGRDQ